MKKLYFIFALFLFSFANAQCPAPTDLMVTNVTSDSVQLNWSETGSANSWEIGVTLNYVIEPSENPTNILVPETNPFTLTGLTFLSVATNCHVFYVRSICNDNSRSEWTKIGYGDCSHLDLNLSATSNTISQSNLIISPNPSNSFVQIELQNTNNNIEKINFYDVLGKTVKSISKITSNKNNIDISALAKGMYLVEITTNNKFKMVKKLVIE